MQSPLCRATAFGAALGFLRVLPGPVAALAFAGFAWWAHRAEPAESAVAETALVESRRAAAAVCRTEELGEASRWRNRVYACPRTALDGDATVYSDASGRADTDAVWAGR